MAFAVAFIGASYPITDSSFVRVDETHYVCPSVLRCSRFIQQAPVSSICPAADLTSASKVLDVGSTVTPQYENLKEVALFLAGPTSLPDPSKALGLYISVGGQEWQYRGYVSTTHPTEASLFYDVWLCQLSLSRWPR